MVRVLVCSMMLLVAAMAGCHVGPASCGLRGLWHEDHTYGCEGCGCDWNSRYLAGGPLEALLHARKRLICGSGCGEIYHGEWKSYPPQCEDPCGFDYCMTPAPCHNPQPLRRLWWALCGIYGKRFCDHCGFGLDDCACGTSALDGGMISGDVHHGGSCDCGSHMAGHPHTYRSSSGSARIMHEAHPKLIAPQTPNRMTISPTMIR